MRIASILLIALSILAPPAAGQGQKFYCEQRAADAISLRSDIELGYKLEFTTKRGYDLLRWTLQCMHEGAPIRVCVFNKCMGQNV